MTAPESIMGVLRDEGAMPASMIWKRLGMNRNTCMNALKRMVDSGAVGKEWTANPFSGERGQRCMCNVYWLVDGSLYEQKMRGRTCGPLPESLSRAISSLERRGYKVIPPQDGREDGRQD